MDWLIMRKTTFAFISLLFSFVFLFLFIFSIKDIEIAVGSLLNCLIFSICGIWLYVKREEKPKTNWVVFGLLMGAIAFPILSTLYLMQLKIFPRGNYLNIGNILFILFIIIIVSSFAYKKYQSF